MAKKRLTTSAVLPWRPVTSCEIEAQANWQDRQAANESAGLAWESAESRENVLSNSWQDKTPQDRLQDSRWTDPQALSGGLSSAWDQHRPQEAEHKIAWEIADPLQASTKVEYQELTPQDQSKKMAWFYAGATLPAAYRGAYAPPLATAVQFDLTGTYAPPSGDAVFFDLSIVKIARTGKPMSALDSGITLYWRMPPPLDHQSRKVWGEGVRHISEPPRIVWPVEPGGPVYPDPEPLIVKTSYIVMNETKLVTTHDQLELDASGVKVSMNIDNGVYTMDAEILSQDSYDRINAQGGAVEVQYIVNGYTFDFLIDDVQESERELKSWTAKGSTLSKTLAAPYAAPSTGGATGAISAKAAAASALTNTGHELNWPTGGDKDAVDWQMPAGVFAYQNQTPIGVVKMLAEAVGAVVVPSLSGDKVITVKPRWPVLPWRLADYPPDYLIHESMITATGHQYQPQGNCNQVTVFGELHGNHTRVYRTDAAGEWVSADDITSPLLTENVANIQRGAQALAEAAPVFVVSLETFLGQQGSGGPALYVPGSIIEVQHEDSAKDYRCLVLSCSLSPDGDAGINQSLQVVRPA